VAYCIQLCLLTNDGCFDIVRVVVGFVALWGLDQDGQFLDGQSKSSIWSKVFSSVDNGVVRRIQVDMMTSMLQAEQERKGFSTCQLSERERSKRVMFHFQKDLMAGLSEQILDAQDSRQGSRRYGRSRTVKVVCWIFLGMEHLGLMFYVLLFGLTKDPPHQQAWAQSFVIWLLMEVVLFATMMVLVNNVLIPMWTMTELKAVRVKVLQAIEEYHRRVGNASSSSYAVSVDGQALNAGVTHGFNAAKYFFVSHRLASYCPDMGASKMVLQYVTPWPRQSYLHTAQAVSSTYSKKYASIYTTVVHIGMFFLFSFLSTPVPIQDLCIQLLSTVVLGYVILLHMQLYVVYPLLVAVPALVVSALVYAIVQRLTATSKVERERKEPISEAPLMAGVHTESGKGHLTDQRVVSLSSALPENPPVGVPHLNRRQSLQVGATMLNQMQQDLSLVSISSDDQVSFDSFSDVDDTMDSERNGDYYDLSDESD
jgi:hypothetical protein